MIKTFESFNQEDYYVRITDFNKIPNPIQLSDKVKKEIVTKLREKNVGSIGPNSSSTILSVFPNPTRDNLINKFL